MVYVSVNHRTTIDNVKQNKTQIQTTNHGSMAGAFDQQVTR
jgi:hypothetical protein